MQPSAPLYNPCDQARGRAPTAYENMLGDAIERGFAQGIEQLEDLVAYLNQSGPPTPSGQAWTPENYPVEIARLADNA